MQRKLTDEFAIPSERLEDFARVATDILYFIRFVRIPHPKLKNPIFADVIYPKQVEILKGITQNRKNIILAARQSGKSTLVLVAILYQLVLNYQVTGVIVSKTGDDAKRMLRRLKFMWRNLPDWLKTAELIGDSKTSIEFSDGSIIYSSNTTENAVRSETLDILYLDELAYIKPNIAQALWSSAYPAVEENGTVYITSTRRGKDDMFYQIWKGAEEGRNDFKQYKIFWWEKPGRDEEWRRKVIQDFGGGLRGELLFEMEYGVDFELPTQETYIDFDSIAEYKSKEPVKQGKSFRIYKEFEEPQVFVIGVDISEGVKSNYSVAQILKVNTKKVPSELEMKATDFQRNIFEQAAVVFTNELDPYKFAELVWKFLEKRYIGKFLFLIESNSVGRGFIGAIEAFYEKYKKEGGRKINLKIAENPGRKHYKGIRATVFSRKDLVLRLKNAIEQHIVEIYDFDTIQDLKNVHIEKKKVGGRDDFAIALGWGVSGIYFDRLFLKTPARKEYKPVTTDYVKRIMRLQDVYRRFGGY